MATAEVLDLRDYVQMLWRRRRWVVVTMLVVVGAAVAQALLQAKTYQSISQVLVLPAEIPGQEVAPNQVILMPNELEIANSAEVAAEVERRVTDRGLTMGTVEVTNPIDTQTLVFEAYAPDPLSAQAIAHEYAQEFLNFRTENLTASIDERIDAVEDQIDLLEERLREVTAAQREATGVDEDLLAVEKVTLAQEIGGLQSHLSGLQLAANVRPGRVLQSAIAPTGPYSPRPVQTLVLGTMVGLLLGVAVAFVRDRLDQRVDSREDAELVAQAPVLGFVPKAASLHRLIAVAQGGDPSAAEAFRSLRSRLLFSASKEAFRTIMVTSALPGEGKTTTAVNLAVALAQADNRVVLVSGDMHHPGLWRYLPERGLTGLADVLAGNVSLSDVVVPTAHENLSFVPSGNIELVPEAALGSSEMLQTLMQLADAADLVVIDAPPALGVSDALDLASLVDRVILTIDATQARKDPVRDGVNELRSVGASVLGVVLTRVDPGQFGRYSYYGGYGPGRRGGREGEPPSAAPEEGAAARGKQAPQPVSVPVPVPVPTPSGSGRSRQPAARQSSANATPAEERGLAVPPRRDRATEGGAGS